MKKTLLLCASLFSFYAQAQEYAPLQVATGFNADVIANGVGGAMTSTTMAVDNANFAFISTDFQATSASTPVSSALPSSGVITSSGVAGMQFQMAPYSGNNSLRIATQNTSGTLTFTNQVAANKLFLLATTGSGQSSITGTINFSDNTTQAIASSVIPDWFNSTTLPIAISGIGRVGRADNAVETPSGNPRIYQLQITVLAANQSKTITGITITKASSAEGIVNLFAVSAEITPTCPSPTALVTSTTATTGTVSWTPPANAPAGGYDYYVSPTNVAPTNTTSPTGNVTNSTVTITNLTVGQTYYVWVRSNCSATDSGQWRPTQFTTGQVTATYTSGELSTLYSDSVTANSTTSCPGVLTVNVPAGFQVASVNTSYAMETASNGWMSEQRSLLACTTTNLKEAAVTSGVGGNTGTYQYNRSNLNIANGATGAVQFELRTWRTYGGDGCSTEYNKVPTGTWSVTVTYQAVLSVADSKAIQFKAYPNPVDNVLNISAGTAVSNVVIYNYLGQKVLEKSFTTENVAVDVSQLTSGNYLVVASDISGNQETLKIVKK
jgi:hypothetical protein